MPARDLQWTGAVDGVTFNTPGNWKDLATGTATSGTTPITGDSCFITDTSNTINAGLSQGAVDLVKLFIGDNFTGQVGTTGTPLSIGVSGVLTYKARASLCAITAGTNGIATALLNGSNTFTLVGGTWTTVNLGPSCNAYITGSATVTNYIGSGGGCIADAGAAFTTSIVGAGTLVSARNIGTATVAGGGALLRAIVAATATSATVMGGARLNWQSTGTITLVTVGSGGAADARGASLGFTITNSTAHTGAISCFDNEAVTIILTNAQKNYRVATGLVPE